MKTTSEYPVKKTVKQLKDLGVWSIFKDKIFAEEVADLNWLPPKDYKDNHEFFFTQEYFDSLLKVKKRRIDSLKRIKKLEEKIRLEKIQKEEENRFKRVLI